MYALRQHVVTCARMVRFTQMCLNNCTDSAHVLDSLLRFVYNFLAAFYKIAVKAGIIREFRVKRGGEKMSLPYHYRMSLIFD